MSYKEELKNQLKFYFSHANYIKDIFLREECEKKTDNELRGIPISTLLIFTKLKALKATEKDILECIESDELKGVIKLRKDSKNNNFLLKKDLTEYETYKQRITEDPDAYILRISGISGDFDEVKTYLSQFMDPLLIRLRKDKKKKEYTGTCFVELSSLKEIDEALNTKIPVMISSKENNDIKRVKKEIEYMEITKKKDYLNKPKLSPHEKQKQILLQKNKGKFFRFECLSPDLLKNKDTDKKEEAKSIVQLIKTKLGAQFVDLKNNVLRFKNLQNFEEKEIEGFKLQKLSCEEEKDYVNKIPMKNN